MVWSLAFWFLKSPRAPWSYCLLGVEGFLCGFRCEKTLISQNSLASDSNNFWQKARQNEVGGCCQYCQFLSLNNYLGHRKRSFSLTYEHNKIVMQKENIFSAVSRHGRARTEMVCVDCGDHVAGRTTALWNSAPRQRVERFGSSGSTRMRQAPGWSVP